MNLFFFSFLFFYICLARITFLCPTYFLHYSRMILFAVLAIRIVSLSKLNQIKSNHCPLASARTITTTTINGISVLSKQSLQSKVYEKWQGFFASKFVIGLEVFLSRLVLWLHIYLVPRSKMKFARNCWQSWEEHPSRLTLTSTSQHNNSSFNTSIRITFTIPLSP